MMNVNIPYSDMTMPIQGPENPFADNSRFQNQNSLAGHVEEQYISEHAFKTQQQTFSILGYSANPSFDPSLPTIIGNVEAAAENDSTTLDLFRPTNQAKKELKRKRKTKGNLEFADGDAAYIGPWASWDGDEVNAYDPEGAKELPEDEGELEPDAPAAVAPKGKPRKGTWGNEKSVFHGKSLTDYQGRTYMHPPLSEAPQLNSEPGSQECFIPKACVHTWTGHTAGVSVIKTFPNTAHMFLSGSMDSKIKVRAQLSHLLS
jgi:pre-mRNA-processing factor 17